jgi:hypothetical protein
MLAIPAASIHTADPRDANASACCKASRTGIRNFCNDLVSWNDFIATWRQVTLNNVQVRSTNTTGAYAQENMAGLEVRFWDLADFQRAF